MRPFSSLLECTLGGPIVTKDGEDYQPRINDNARCIALGCATNRNSNFSSLASAI